MIVTYTYIAFSCCMAARTGHSYYFSDLVDERNMGDIVEDEIFIPTEIES